MSPLGELSWKTLGVCSAPYLDRIELESVLHRACLSQRLPDDRVDGVLDEPWVGMMVEVRASDRQH